MRFQLKHLLELALILWAVLSLLIGLAVGKVATR